MKGLISQDLLVNILKDTGAYKGGRIQHVLHGDFKPCDFRFKKPDEFDVSAFDKGFEKFSEAVQADWVGQYIDKCDIEVGKCHEVELNNYEYREETLCVQLKSKAVADCFYIFFKLDTFYYLLNHYLGGAGDSVKAVVSLTDIEMQLFKKMVERLNDVLTVSFNYLDKMGFEVTDFCMSEEAQEVDFPSKSLVTELSFSQKDRSYSFAFAMPESFLVRLKQKAEETSYSEHKKLDPLWKRVVTAAFLSEPLDLEVSLGRLNIPFKKSISLKVGDMFDWDKSNTDVIVYHENIPRLVGDLGVIGENFAVKVKELAKK